MLTPPPLRTIIQPTPILQGIKNEASCEPTPVEIRLIEQNKHTGGKYMKRKAARTLFISLGLLFLFTFPTFADDGGKEVLKTLAQIKITEEEREEIQDILTSYVTTIKIPEAELEILQAQLTRELIVDNPDMKRVEELVEESLEWEGKIRIAGIKRELAMKDLLGDRKWALMKRTTRLMKGRLTPEQREKLAQHLQQENPALLGTFRLLQQF